MGGDGWVERGGPQGGHYPPISISLSLSTEAGIFSMPRDTPPLAEGQRGFLLERWEIVASLGKWRESLGKVVHYCLCTGGIALHGFR